jgi:fumarate hydratase class II
MPVRIETDSMGEMAVPADALYGASTQRAVLNFPVSGRRIPYPVIHAYGLIKGAVARVIGNDAAVTWCGANGNLDLNVMMPAMAAALLESIELLTNASNNFRTRCLDDITASEERCAQFIEHSLAMVTGLNSKIGYDKASEIAKLSAQTGTPVRQLCLERLTELGITEAELTEALDPARMCAPDASMVGPGGDSIPRSDSKINPQTPYPT